MFNSLITLLVVFILAYVVSGYMLQIIEIYELGLQEYEKIKKDNIIKEIKNELKNSVSY